LSFENLEIAILPSAMKKFAMMKTSFLPSSSQKKNKIFNKLQIKNDSKYKQMLYFEQ
jgi:hypothetical protein